VHATIYSYYWGQRQFVPACTLQFVNLVVVPSGVLLIPRLTVAECIGTIGLGWLLVDLAFAAALVRRCASVRPKLAQLRQATGLLLQYGAPRLPGELLLGILLALPPSLAAHYQGLDYSGFVGLGQSFLTLIGAPFALVGQLLLPTISSWDGTGQHERVARTIKQAALATMAGSIVIWALLAANASALIGGFFGHEYLEAANEVRIICFGAVGYCLYVVMRNVLDAIHIFPFNAKNLALATGVLLATSWLLPVSESFALSMWVLGLLSFIDVARLQRHQSAARKQTDVAAGSDTVCCGKGMHPPAGRVDGEERAVGEGTAAGSTGLASTSR
jgi:O-antigen/teichoic acid export membrane protein